MKPLQIDFSGRSRLLVFNPGDPVHILYAGIMIVAAVLLVSGVALAARLNAQSAQLKQSIDRIESTQRAKDETSSQTDQLSIEETEAINAAVMNLNYPWAEFFKSLEGHNAPGIAVVSVETGVARQATKIIVEAPGMDEALSYLQSLKLEPMFANVTLTKQESVANADNAASMRFTLEAPTTLAPAKSARRGGS